MTLDLLEFRDGTGAALNMLDETRNELELNFALRALELIGIVSRGVQVLVEPTKGCVCTGTEVASVRYSIKCFLCRFISNNGGWCLYGRR